MRILLTILFLVSLSFNVSAIEPVNDQQVMLYYHIPLGGANKQQSKHQFGVRLDNTSHDPRDVVQISALEARPAAFDFRMGYDGVQSIRIHGVDYAEQLVARAAAEGESAPVEPATESETPAVGTETTAEPAPEETAPAETAEAPAEKGPIQQKLDELPFGVVIGVILGIGIIAGVGG
jgi:hypothetical protein